MLTPKYVMGEAVAGLSNEFKEFNLLLLQNSRTRGNPFLEKSHNRRKREEEENPVNIGSASGSLGPIEYINIVGRTNLPLF